MVATVDVNCPLSGYVNVVNYELVGVFPPVYNLKGDQNSHNGCLVTACKNLLCTADREHWMLYVIML